MDYVDNPRRAPRALIGCEARVVRETGAAFEGPVIDLGPTGCQVVTAAPLAPHEHVRLELRNRAIAGTSQLRGQVIWAAAEPPFRAGLQFDPECGDAAALLYGQLAAANPDLVDVGDVHERVPLSARIVPWRREEDAAVLPGEEEVLLAIGGGIRLGELKARLGPRWEAAVNPLFALLARRLLVVEEERVPAPRP